MLNLFKIDPFHQCQKAAEWSDFFLGLHVFTASDHFSWSQSILLSFIHQWSQSFSIIVILKNDYSEYIFIDCLKVIAQMNTKVILFLMNETFWKVKLFFLWQNFIH